ncbi:MAG: hypothetical protein PHE27_04135 [Alphaproteobacteria bacterium]|nr:hypothetical protein [Alphaproteobacteria bacterium]
MTTQAMCEERMVFLVRNALLVAEQEMGGGDQWPVVKDTIYKIMKDWEDLKTERNVDAELKIHLYEQIQMMESGLDECSPETRALVEPKICEWREICDAYFSDVDREAVETGDDYSAPHIRRMNAILDTMEDDHAAES